MERQWAATACCTSTLDETTPEAGSMVEGEAPNELLITLETTGRPTNLTLTDHELHVVSIDSSKSKAVRLARL